MHLHEEEKAETMEATPPGHHLAPNWPLQVCGSPIDPYKYHSHGLVVVPQAKPYRESTQVFARAPNVVLVVSELLDLYLFFIDFEF
jgi:hypothetical protein